MQSLRLGQVSIALFVLCVAAAIAAPAQTFTTLNTGVSSSSSLVQGIDGNLYGTNSAGAPEAGGTIFKITPEGALSTFYTFPGHGGPTGLAVETNGNLYGTTQAGGSAEPGCPSPALGCGTVFELTTAGVHRTLHSFNGSDGTAPMGGLTLGPDGSTFYGTTFGTTFHTATGFLYGTIFKITGEGTFTLLHTFSQTDGAHPAAPLVLGTNGKLYGTTTQGGTSDAGTVFEIDASGTFTTLHSFNPKTEGWNPWGALVQGANGNFYGTAFVGGTNCSDGTLDPGTVFEISPSGATFRTVYNFSKNCDDGHNSHTGLVLGADSNFYGVTIDGGVDGMGSIFELTPAAAFTNLHSFGPSGQVDIPGTTLMQATNGSFYGTITTNLVDSAFSLSTGLSPFVEAVPPFRGIGSRVLLLGQGFTGASSVTFNGVSATFTIDSDTEIVTTVPVGATKGFIVVTTPSGTVSTKVFFTVG